MSPPPLARKCPSVLPHKGGAGCKRHLPYRPQRHGDVRPMSDERLLFDRRLLRARRARFAHEIEAREFLLAHVAREIAERVDLMLRPFPLALDLGAHHGLLGRRVAELPSVGEMIYAESAFALAALCPRPSLVCDEDLLPFKEASQIG